MRYDFIEIGTCDFKALVHTASDKDVGLSVEPVLEYLVNLPRRYNTTKLNAAVSDRYGTVEVHYVKPDVAERFGKAFQGCTMVDSLHPKIKSAIDAGRISESDVISDVVPMYSLADLIRMFHIDEIGTLKVDAEGMDCKILYPYFLSDRPVFPDKLIFEANSLTPESESQKLISLMTVNGYTITHRGRDVVMEK